MCPPLRQYLLIVVAKLERRKRKSCRRRNTSSRCMGRPRPYLNMSSQSGGESNRWGREARRALDTIYFYHHLNFTTISHLHIAMDAITTSFLTTSLNVEASNGTLCEYCAKIPFSHLLPTLPDSDYDRHYKGPTSWPIGTFKQARSRLCPFCTLLTSICCKPDDSWAPLTEPHDSEEISARWNLGSFTASPHSRLGASVCLVGTNQSNREFCAKGALDPWINFFEIRRWISICQKQHVDCPAIPHSTLNFRTHHFRLIDVNTECIVQAPENCMYLVLSYVWGNPTDGRLLLRLENQQELLEPGGLTRVWSTIPATIRDAMAATKKLGYSYLWVDSLCLCQNDPSELQECVMFMDKIYQEATLTIVAATGDDAHAGLPGVKPTSRKTSRLVRDIVPGLRMTTIQGLECLLRPSKYAQRGWT